MQSEEIKVPQDPSGPEPTSVHPGPGQQRTEDHPGESESPTYDPPSRGDQFSSIRQIRPQFSTAQLADFTGEFPEIGDQKKLHELAEKLLPVARLLPTWRDHNWTDHATIGQVFAHITSTITIWRRKWSDWYSIREIFIGDPREYEVRNNRLRSAKKKKNDEDVWVLWAFEESEGKAMMPCMACLWILKDLDPKLYAILGTIVGKLNITNGVALWDYLAETAEEMGIEAPDADPQELWEDAGAPGDADPEFIDDISEGQQRWHDIQDYWATAEPTLVYVKRQGKRVSMTKLHRMIRQYRWNKSRMHKRIYRWVSMAMEVIESGKRIDDYAVKYLSDESEDMASHAGEYQWFRWFGAHTGNAVELGVDQMMQASYQEGGFFPLRTLFKYTTDEKFIALTKDPFPKQFETMMWEAHLLFNANFIKNLKRKPK